MEKCEPTREELFKKIRTLEERLWEAEQAIEAIQSGEVDALVIHKPHGEQLYTLTGAEHGYRVLVESIAEGALILSSDDSIYYCNRTLGEMLGLPIQKIVGTKLDSYVPGEGGGQLRELIKESRSCGAAKGEFPMKRNDGTLMQVNISLNCMSMMDFEGVCAVITDLSEQKQVQEELRRHRTELEFLVNKRTADLQQEIIERKQAEEELRRSRSELELRVQERTKELVEANQALSEKAEVIDLAHDAIIARDAANRIIFWSRGAQETYGFTREEALGRRCNELLKTVFPVTLENIEKTVLEKGEWQGELKHTKANGEPIIVDSRWAVRTGKVKEAAGYLEINRDITSRKIIEEELRRTDRAFRTLSECNQTMTRQTEEMELLQQVCRIVVDVGGYRMAWVGFAENDENKTVLPIASAGYDHGYLDQAQISWADSERGRGPTGTAIRTGKIITSQNALISPAYGPWRSAGTSRGYVSSIALPLIVRRKVIGSITIYASELDAFDEGEARLLSNLAENLAYGIASIRAAEQRRQSEEELRVYASRLELVNSELQDFAFIASHDLQEPLRKIQTFCDMLTKRSAPILDATSNDYLDRVMKSASRMRQLLRDLLEFSRVATRLEPFKKIDLVQIVREAADVFEASVKETGCKFEIENMPAIDADETQMLGLFQNLIGNALKFRGGENPHIKVCGKIHGKGICEIFVKDNGIGFDPQFAEVIFKPFQRLHRSEYEGTGMGLAICRKIVERHGGSIRVESEQGKGSTFIISLPARHDRPEGR